MKTLERNQRRRTRMLKRIVKRWRNHWEWASRDSFVKTQKSPRRKLIDNWKLQLLVAHVDNHRPFVAILSPSQVSWATHSSSGSNRHAVRVVLLLLLLKKQLISPSVSVTLKGYNSSVSSVGCKPTTTFLSRQSVDKGKEPDTLDSPRPLKGCRVPFV